MTIASGTFEDGDLPYPVRDVPPSATSPELVVRFLVGEMAKLGLVAPKLVEEVVTLAMKREELGVTAIGRGIAIPHATTQAVAEITSIVGRLPSPIDWDALDGEPVRAVFLSIVPAIYPDTHQKHLAIFAEFAKSL